MLKQKFAIFILLFNCSLFANIGNFELQAKKSIKVQLQQPTETFLTSKKSLEDYYFSNNYKPFWVDENGLKEISFSLIDKLKNDPVLKPQASKIFRLEEIKTILNSLNTTSTNYIDNLIKLDFILTESFDKYVSYIANGAIRWDGFDLAIKGWEHVKSKNQGLGISRSHYQTFYSYWAGGNRLKNASGNQNAIFNPEFQMLGKKLTYSPAIQGYWKGMVLYNSSAAYGGTIFWRPVSNFIIKGVNLNRNFRKVNGSKNKPL